MTVTHNNTLYRVTPLAGDVWQLTDVEKPRNKIKLTRRQMQIAGFGHLRRSAMRINHHHLRAAQSKAAIAVFLSDGAMWMEAHRQIKDALGLPWYRPNR